jgi:hypothetical protein
VFPFAKYTFPLPDRVFTSGGTNPQNKKKDSQLYEQRFVIKNCILLKYKWQETLKTAKFHL